MPLGALIRRWFGRETRPAREIQLVSVEQSLDYRFHNPDLLREALTHRSFVRPGSGSDQTSSYERLEFLGDAVLGLVISELLFQKYQNQDEGELTKLKAALVNEVTLARLAHEIGLGLFVYISSEEERGGGRERNSLLADTYEAVLGAVYLDGGLKAVHRILKTLLFDQMEDLLARPAFANYKGALLEFMQARGMGMPRYHLESERGPDHAKEFIMTVFVQNKKMGTGRGTTKKEAEQKAAAIALEKLSGTLMRNDSDH